MNIGAAYRSKMVNSATSVNKASQRDFRPAPSGGVNIESALHA